MIFFILAALNFNERFFDKLQLILSELYIDYDIVQFIRQGNHPIKYLNNKKMHF